ncbi:MAG: YihY/virulence factor BrkB family protein [Treponema sp.]|nr:YihY/virulence factor BrkB family protein [Treponema sp.]MCL2271530.1 YihY/virulence factor BrkB family protein [Treponema sp.]
MKKLIPVLQSAGKNFFRKIYITIHLYRENGLANHAAAGAYGFLLSMAPMLLLLAFFIFYIFRPSPESITVLIGTIPFLNNIFDESWLFSDIFILTKPGIPGIISAVTIIWSGRILALSIQRGLRIAFPARRRRSPVKDTLVSLAIEASVIILVFIAIISSRTAVRLYDFFNFLPDISIIKFFTSHFGVHISSITLLGIASYFVYIFVPVKPPLKLSAFQSALLCSTAYFCTAFILGFIINRARISFLYGAFGNLIIILINVYFFFFFFFFGAQYAFVNDHYEALLFSRLRILKKSLEKDIPQGLSGKFNFTDFLYRLFHPSGNRLNKYFKNFKKGEIIFLHKNSKSLSGDVYYLLDGEAEITISSVHGGDKYSNILKPDAFFGGMGYHVSEHEIAVVMAASDASIIIIPPSLFKAIIKYDSYLDRTLIKDLAGRHKVPFK